MADFIIIYRERDSRWMDACKWAKDNGITRVMSNAGNCYKGLNHRAIMFYADDDRIVSDYGIKGTLRLTNQQIDQEVAGV